MKAEIPNLAEREQYAKDLPWYARPWERWQVRQRGQHYCWGQCHPDDMHFHKDYEYRRKPDTLTIAGREVVKPFIVESSASKTLSNKGCVELRLTCNSLDAAKNVEAALNALLGGESE